jgi:hypothetical protein
MTHHQSCLQIALAASQVFDTPGGHVTRDYREGLGQLADLAFRLLDTSGLEPAAHPATLQVRTKRNLHSGSLDVFSLLQLRAGLGGVMGVCPTQWQLVGAFGCWTHQAWSQQHTQPRCRCAQQQQHLRSRKVTALLQQHAGLSECVARWRLVRVSGCWTPQAWSQQHTQPRCRCHSTTTHKQSSRVAAASSAA